MTNPQRRAARRRSILDSPWLSALLVLVSLAIAGALIVPALLPSVTPSASPSSASATPATTTLPPSVAPTFARPTPSPAPTFAAYVVRPGDTLNSIARAYATTARSIAWWNRGAYPTLDPESEAYDPDHLEVGWVLQLIPGIVVDDTNPPTPSPGPPTPTPAPTPGFTSSPGPTSAPVAPATVVSHGSRATPTIALTFDMGGRLDPAVAIVQWLIDHEVHATLFPTGKSATQTTLGLQAMELAATRPDLFDLGNHSWDHPDFRDLTKAQMAEQLSRTETALVPVLGTTRPWFRPPYGGWNDTVRAGVGTAGWMYVVMWDVDTIDWRPVADGGPTAAGIEAKIRDKAQGGSIVLMHLGGWNTLQALPGILDAVGDLGLEPVTLSEMLGG